MTGGRGGPRAGGHGPFDELAVGWALHALEPEDEAVFARHLPDCARCARTVAETSEVMAAMAADLPAAEPSPDLRARLRAAVERTDQAPPSSPDLAEVDDAAEPHERTRPIAPVPPRPAASVPRPQPPAQSILAGRPALRRVLPTALVAVAVVAILSLGTWAVVLGEARDRAEALAAQQAEIMDALMRPGTATIAPVTDEEGRAVATVVARDGQMQVVTNGLRVNDAASSIYVVWGMHPGEPVPLGTFDVVQPQMDLRTVGSDQTGLDDFSAYAISLEPGRRAPSTPTDVVANGQVTS